VGKVKRLFVCSSCARPAAQWAGRCLSCGEWGTIGEHPAGSGLRGAPGGATASRVETLAPDDQERRIGTGSPGLDRVLGGGLVPGSAVLLAGAPGIGKSTLLLQLASRLNRAGHSCLLASGEEARGQVAARARRLGLDGAGVAFVPGRDLTEVLDAAISTRPGVLLLDSIQTIRDAASTSPPGGPGQVRGCADALIGLAKDRGTTLVLSGHVTKEGDLAGPRTLEHAVDTVLTFEGDPRTGRRLLAGGKNRFGPEGEVAWFEMTARGLEETETGPRIGDEAGEAGCATVLALAGRRAFAVEVQALVVPSDGPARRQVTGLDPRRFHILSAVTERATGVRLSRAELFGAAAGGLRLDDPGSDLAVAAALASAGSGAAVPPGIGFFGEVSLTGAVRGVAGAEARVSAAAAAGVRAVVLPADAWSERLAKGPVRAVRVRHLREAVSWLGEARGTAPITTHAP
jgi:DNA repair protein RadA/Sms